MSKTAHENRVSSRNAALRQPRNENRVSSRNAEFEGYSDAQLATLLERSNNVIFGTPEDRAAGRRVVGARSAAMVCAKCGGAVGAVVYRARVNGGRFFGRPLSVFAPVCESCASPDMTRRDSCTGGYEKPWGRYGYRESCCNSCGRAVVYEAGDHDLRSRMFCSERCRWGYHNARASKRTAADRAKSCEVCGGAFTATRADAKTCSPACKQKAYRQRKRGAA